MSRGHHRNPREPSTTTAERFLRFYASRTGAPPSPRKQRPPRYHPRDTPTFRAVVLDRIGRAPKPPTEIFRDVVNDYGSCEIRRLWRALRFWITVGRIERTEDGYRRTSIARGGGGA